MADLPIIPILPAIRQGLAEHDNLVLQAEPGAGKSTAVPLELLKSPWLNGRKVLLLEPRRLAVKSIAYYLSEQLGETVGQRVGYQIRNERRVSRETQLEIVTEGILTRRLQQDPELSDVALVIFDEFHERSLHADLALSLCLDVQAALRDDLKLLVMSATIDLDAVQSLLAANGASVAQAQAPGRTYPVSEHYLPKPLASMHFREVLPALIQQIRQAWQETEKDILVFLAGQGEIRRVQERLEETPWPNTVIRPLYGALKPEEQELALVPDADGRRKVVLATNIAETSLTIDGISAVVDSGLSRKALYDVSSGMTALTTQRVSEASAEQRKGRAGRLSAGRVYRLWTESQQLQLADFDPPEIEQADLSAVCLELAIWGIHNPADLNWMTPPPKAHFDAAQALLMALDLLTDTGQVTDWGRKAAEFGWSPRLAVMCLKAESVCDLSPHQAKTLATDLAAVLSERDVLQTRDDADLIQRVLALQAYRQNRSSACQAYSVQRSAMEQALKNARSALKKLDESSPCQPLSLAALQAECGKLVALAYPDRVAKRRGTQGARFQMSNGKGAVLAEFDPLAQQDWLAVAQLDGQRQDGRIYLAAPLALTDIEGLFAEQIEERPYLGLNKSKGELAAVQQRWLQKLLLSEKPLNNPDTATMQAALLGLLADDLSLLPWRENTQAWLKRVNWLAGFDSDHETPFPNFDQAWLKAHLDDWLAPYLNGVTTIKGLQSLDVLMLLQSQLTYEQQQVLAQQAPTHYTTPSGHRVRIDYSGASPKVSVILQEMFGELTSPMLAWGQVPLTFELLSPARRPIQVTSDLANFWQTSYFEVAKDMKGRYPKHRWPDKPLEEKPGRSVKSKPAQ